MNLQLTLALRYLNGRKLRTFLTTTAIVFGVTLIFGMNLVLPTMIAALETNVQAGEGAVDFSITNLSGEPFPYETLAGLLNLEGVRAVSGSLQRTINLPPDFIDKDSSRVDRVKAINLVGVVPEMARSLRSYPLVSGRYLQDLDRASAVISQSLADDFSISLDGTIQIPSANGVVDLTVVGIRPADFKFGNEDVLVNLPQAQLMLDEPGNINIIDLNMQAFAGKDQHLEMQRRIESVLGPQYRVGNPAASDELFASLELGRITLSLFGLLALFMGGFIILNTFRTVVTERRRDIGMLRAIGATRRAVLGIILVEGLLQGVVGSIIGLVLGYFLAFAVLRVAQAPMSQFVNLQLGLPVVTGQLIGLSVGLGVGVTLFAGLLPAYYASKVTPIEALRPSLAEVEFKQTSRWNLKIGVAIIVVTVAAIFSGWSSLIIPGGFLFLLGLVLITPGLVRPFANTFGQITNIIYARKGIGLLAKSNLTRQSTRVAVTVSASMLGLAVIVTAGGLVTSMTGTIKEMIHKSLGSDYLFVPPSVAIWGSNVGANPKFAEQLRSLDQVDAVSTFRYAASQTNGQAVSVIGIDPVDFPKVSGLRFTQGDESAYGVLASGRDLIANGAFLAATGSRVGEDVDMLSANGKVRYHIVASAVDLLNAKVTTAYISQANLAADFGSMQDVFIQINLKKGANKSIAAENIRELGKDYPQFKLVSGADYYATVTSQINAAFSAIYILFLVVALPSLIAMLNTLTIGVIERTREIGMLRAVGGTQQQIREMVLIEALLLAAIGTAFGILGGLYLGYVFVVATRVFFPMGYYFPQWGILAALAIGLSFGALAALIPASQAARINVVDALRYE